MTRALLQAQLHAQQPLQQPLSLQRCLWLLLPPLPPTQAPRLVPHHELPRSTAQQAQLSTAAQVQQQQTGQGCDIPVIVNPQLNHSKNLGHLCVLLHRPVSKPPHAHSACHALRIN